MPRDQRATTPETKYIYETPTGWDVKIILGGGLVDIREHFSASEFKGCMLSTFKAAQKWRNEALKNPALTHDIVCPLSLEVRRNPATIAARNESGIIGIAVKERRTATGKKYRVWEAYWQEGEKYKKKHYSELKHGKEDAFYFACVKRYAHCGPLMITNNRKKWPLDITEFLTCNT